MPFAYNTSFPNPYESRFACDLSATYRGCADNPDFDWQRHWAAEDAIWALGGGIDAPSYVPAGSAAATGLPIIDRD